MHDCVTPALDFPLLRLIPDGSFRVHKVWKDGTLRAFRWLMVMEMEKSNINTLQETIAAPAAAPPPSQTAQNKADSVSHARSARAGNFHPAALFEFTERLHRAGSLKELCDAALDAVQQGLACDVSAVVLRTNEGKNYFAAYRGLAEPYRQTMEEFSPWPPDDPDPKLLICTNCDEADHAVLREALRGNDMSSALMVPLVLRGSVIGRITTLWRERQVFTGDALSLALTVGRQLAISIERKRSEENTLRLAAVVESSDDAIITKDLNGIITSWNAGAQRIFGYTAAEAIGRPVTMLIPAERQDEEPAILSRIRRGERVDHYETVRQSKDGTLLNISLTVSPLKMPDGTVVGASKIARDITDRMRAKEVLEETVADRTARLRDTVAELEAFSYSVAHDMRAPLRAMCSYATLLNESYGASMPPEAKGYLDRIRAGAQRLDGLITDVLDYSKITRGEMHVKNLSLDDLTREVVDSYGFPKDSVTVQSPLLSVVASPAMLAQVLSNLLSNALKFVAPGVKPHVTVRTEPRGEVVRTWVEDNGIGISDVGKKRIFNMFQRLNPAGVFEGTGIGLTIVRKAVERMGGKVGVESELGMGSRFWFELKKAVK